MEIVDCVIIGKDRTLMTESVIKSIRDNIEDAEINFIIVSDRSRNGHVNAIRNFLHENSIMGEVLETTKERFGIGSAMNIGSEHAKTRSDFFIMSENDWLLRRRISIMHYSDVIDNTNIGNISFKHLNDYCNVDVTKLKYDKDEFAIKWYRDNGRPSFDVEFGPQIVSYRFLNIIGKMKENSGPGEAESYYGEVYHSMPKEFKNEMRILTANDVKYLHENLNANNCVFNHIGYNSSHGCIWNIPSEYMYLSNEKKDIEECNRFK